MTQVSPGTQENLTLVVSTGLTTLLLAQLSAKMEGNAALNSVLQTSAAFLS